LHSALRNILFILGLIIIEVPEAFSQANFISGEITDQYQKPVPFINIHIKALGLGAVSDDHGKFEIKSLAEGTYELTVSGVGYETQVLKAPVPGRKLTITLAVSQQELNEVVVVGKSETQVAKEHSIKAEVINVRAVATQPSNMIDLMKRSSGIIVRQTGGMGSTAELSFNGYQGRAIKYFKDGVPMDYLGAGFNFTLVPLSMLERIEIFKGVLPTYLGADALGGALNLVTKRSYKRYAEASYELASFNTHRASLNVYYLDTVKHFFAGADAFLNYSDNDYDVTVEGKEYRLFHNTFSHYYGEVYGGVVNTAWADELRIGLTAFDMNRDNQYGSQMDIPFGASTSRQYSIVPTIRYQKGFLKDRLQLDQFFVANTLYVTQVDTAGGNYNWEGEFEGVTGKIGEITRRGSLSKTGFSYLTSRTNLRYSLAQDHFLEFNLVYSKFSRKGRDPLGITFQQSGRDVLSVPAYFNKAIAAMGLESRFLDGRIVNNLIGRFYQAEARATDADFYGEDLNRDATYTRWGLANAIKFRINDESFIRVSGEAATRLPEPDEIFGDGNLRVSNMELRPERSMNANIGFRREKRDRYFIELNSFYRITRDQILNVPHQFLWNQYQNVENVKGIGLEADASVAIRHWLNVNGNVTYQDLRLFDTENSETEGARLRNTPYFFSNLGLSSNHTSLITKSDQLQAYWYFTFVRLYYLDYMPKSLEPEGFLGLWGDPGFQTDRIIPDQSMHTAGITYQPGPKGLVVGIQCKNILDNTTYDKFRIQNAGRSFHVKLSYTIN
jgi:outer membrane cobalamin receptor